jgi:hypothetical protein
MMPSFLGRGLLGLAAAFVLVGPGAARADDGSPPKAVRVPYQLTETKHILVRIKFNGQGPFNFILDTGAPALFVGTECAKKIGVKPEKNGVGVIDTMEIEGGVKQTKVPAIIEDPFQLVGMNKMNLPGVRYDGMLGYTVLAKYRIEFDFTRRHLLWTKLDWEPPPPAGLADLGGKPPAEFGAMNAMASLAAMLMGRRPDPVIVYRGMLGVELAEQDGVVVRQVYADGPAAQAGLRPGDRLVRFAGKEVKSLADLTKLAEEKPPGESLAVEVRRGEETKLLTVHPIKGL